MNKQKEKPMAENKYTQRQWDRTVGYGPVPDEYKLDKKDIDKKPIKKEGETK